MIVRPITATMLLLPFVAILIFDGIIGVVEGFASVNRQTSPSVSIGIGKENSNAPSRQCNSCMNLALGEYSIDLERPLGMILEERGEGGNSGVQVQEVLKDESAGSAWKSGRVAPCELLLQINGIDVSSSSFDNVMDILTSPSDKPTTSLVVADGLGQFDMPKNVVQQLKTTDDAFFVDAVVREAVRAIRRDGRLGDLLSVEVIVGAGVTVQDNIMRGMVRFFGIFSTDGVTSYSCNVSATGIRKIGSSPNQDDPNQDIQIVSLSCAKDEGLGRTYDLILED